MFGAITHGAFYASEIYEWQGVVFRFQAKKQRSTLQESRLPAPDQNLFPAEKAYWLKVKLHGNINYPLVNYYITMERSNIFHG